MRLPILITLLEKVINYHVLITFQKVINYYRVYKKKTEQI